MLKSDHFRGNSRLAKALTNSPPVKKGEAGHAVRLIQRALIDLEFPMPISVQKHGTPDGIYGKETKDSVREFQRKAKGLDKDGIVGANTLARLDGMLVDRKIRFKPLPPLPPGSPGASGFEPGSKRPGKTDPPPPRNPHLIERYLNVTPQAAMLLAPAVIRPFQTDARWTEEAIRHYLAASVRVARMTKLALHSLASHSDREPRWNTGFEHWWFGDYTERKFTKVIDTFDAIVQHLTSSRLFVIGKDRKKGYASANPGIRKIKLGQAWIAPAPVKPDKTPATLHDKKAERVQTFVHEAAHIAGRTNGASEHNHYGRDAAHKLSFEGMRATRSADNYGYYAIDLATEGQHRNV